VYVAIHVRLRVTPQFHVKQTSLALIRFSSLANASGSSKRPNAMRQKAATVI